MERIEELFRTTFLTDLEIATHLLKEDGLFTSPNQVKEIRIANNWRRHLTDEVAQAVRQTETTQEVHTLLHDGQARNWGRRWTMTHLRRKQGYRANDRDVSKTLKQLNPQAVAERRPGVHKKRRENASFHGPDWCWCLDGHDKLARYGIEIYAAIDAFSRRIIWFHCGLSNRTQVSVLCQYLQAVRKVGKCPDFLRTDHGAETYFSSQPRY